MLERLPGLRGLKINKPICGSNYCRACKSSNLFRAINMGTLPIANELCRESGLSTQTFPLELSICSECGLGQVADVVGPDRLFEDYRYLSSISDTFMLHSKEFAEIVKRFVASANNEWVLEIASNDGYFLRNFIGTGIDILGVEPSRNVSARARAIGIPTINAFFGKVLAHEILKSKGHPKVIVANNVLAHVPDLVDFLAGCRVLANEDTLISIENPSILNILHAHQFDSIYHEHYSYLSATSVNYLANQVGLKLVDVEEVPTHGGSNRYWLRINGEVSNSVTSKIEQENFLGLTSQQAWAAARNDFKDTVGNFSIWVRDRMNEGSTLFGYGAAAKASTLINCAGLNEKVFLGIGDKSPEKQGWFMPSLDIPIISLDQLVKANPSDIMIFPWNISDEISVELKSLLPDSRLWVAVPEILRK